MNAWLAFAIGLQCGVALMGLARFGDRLIRAARDEGRKDGHGEG